LTEQQLKHNVIIETGILSSRGYTH